MLDPKVLEYLPASHLEQDDDCITENMPAEHIEHMVDPLMFEYVPAEQLLQFVEIVEPAKLE